MSKLLTIPVAAAAAIATLVVSNPTASAQPIVLESYVGERPADADALVGPILKIMKGRNYLVGKSLSKRIESRHSSPAGVASPAELAEAQRLVESGRKQYIQGAFDKAVIELGRARGILEAKPVTMVGKPKVRATYFDALVYLAMAHRQQKSVKATEVMAEVIRSFPNKTISRFRYGPAALQLYRTVKSKLAAQGATSIGVKLDNSTAVVFVNESFRGTGDTTAASLKPGTYRVFTKVGSRNGRVHTVMADGGATASASINFAVDSTLRTRQFVGLQFGSEVERKARGAKNAIAVARSVKATGVVVLFVGMINDQRAIGGAYYSVDSAQPTREAAIATDNATPAALTNLARLLGGESVELTGNLIGGSKKGADSGATTPEGTVTKSTSAKRPYKTWKWVALLGGAAAVAGGAVLVAVHEPEVVEGMRNLDARNTKTAGFVGVGVGAALVVGGLLLWIKDSGHAKEQRMAVSPTRGGAMFAFGGSF